MEILRGVKSQGEHRVQGGTQTLGLKLGEGTETRMRTVTQGWNGVPRWTEPTDRGRAQQGSWSSMRRWEHREETRLHKGTRALVGGGVQERVEGELGSSGRNRVSKQKG